MQMQIPLTGAADVGIIGRGKSRKCIIQFTPLQRPGQHIHQHLRYGHEAVDRYRRGTDIAFGLFEVHVGLWL